MKTIALRFAENFAPDCGTIKAHRELIDQLGHVWYGKLGNPVSEKVAKDILKEDDPQILLIHSGGQDRWWAYVSEIQRDILPLEEIPSYYRNKADDFGCWFKVSKFEKAPKNVMSHCFVTSSGKSLTSASRHSMSSYFIIEYRPEKNG
ncbi:hypothetical protein [Bifidobacterium magnum]|uniref:Pua-like domain-containing protein n=1 Tax=Bifidobacterium magnum TaxID=1692 RepID=A0A087B9T9_9BIFI|nr:hypothetical protein [Bifidobacterium magnum]KFI67789.1 hypothetical protein BMAGN_5009 [Bifidobacterium magnum]